MREVNKEGILVRAINQLLIQKSGKDQDRAVNVNAPSQACVCLRANYYSRLQYEWDSVLQPRSLRIFNNGTGVHERLQAYLKETGLLLMDEVPLRNDEYNIQGHTDGFLVLNKGTKKPLLKKKKRFGVLKKHKESSPVKGTEIAILEIKSINSDGFKKLTTAKDEHQVQGMVYIFCAENRRQQLRDTYSTFEEFKQSEEERIEYYKSLYLHLKDGSKHTKEEKLKLQIDLNLKADEILFNTSTPITKVIFLYENKNDQDFKEYCISLDQEILDWVLDRYNTLNEYVNEALKAVRQAEKKKKRELTKDEILDIYDEIAPEREGTCKSCTTCKWCNFPITCWY
jgi:hypothetical protein